MASDPPSPSISPRDLRTARCALLQLYEAARFWNRTEAPTQRRLESEVTWALRHDVGLPAWKTRVLRRVLRAVRATSPAR